MPEHQAERTVYTFLSSCWNQRSHCLANIPRKFVTLFCFHLIFFLSEWGCCGQTHGQTHGCNTKWNSFLTCRINPRNTSLWTSNKRSNKAHWCLWYILLQKDFRLPYAQEWENTQIHPGNWFGNLNRCHGWDFRTQHFGSSCRILSQEVIGPPFLPPKKKSIKYTLQWYVCVAKICIVGRASTEPHPGKSAQKSARSVSNHDKYQHTDEICLNIWKPGLLAYISTI